MSPRTRKYLDWGLIIAINFMWATQAPMIKWIGERVGPVAIAFIPMILSTLMFLPVLWIENRRQRRRFRWRWDDARHFLLAGLLGLFFLQFTYTLGAQRTLAANAGIITLTIPVFVTLAASFLLRERLNRVRVLSFLIAMAGVLLTSLQDLRSANFLASDFLAGNMIFLAACAGCGFYNAYCKLLVEKQYTELEILVYTSIVGSLASVPLLIWVEPFRVGHLLAAGPMALWGILELSFVVYGCSMLLFFRVLKRMDVTQAILGNYLLPFFIALLAVVFLKESITPVMLLGGTVILLSTLVLTVFEGDLLEWLDRRRRPASAIVLFALAGFSPALQGQGPEPPGWFAGDPHVHRGILCSRNAADRMLTPEELLEMMRPNGLAVISVLGDMGNGEIREASEDLKLIKGKDHPISKAGRIVHWDAEWHFDPKGVTFDQKVIGGHLIVLGLRHAERIHHEYTYPVIEWARTQGAVVGFAHMQHVQEGIPEALTCCYPIEYPVEVALGSRVFLMEDVRGSDPAMKAYYRLLNCGFRPGIAAGSDYPCGRDPAPLGNLLTYVRVPGGKLTYRKWVDGIAAGRVVVSRNAHHEFLDLKVNGASGPGDEVKLPAAGTISVEVRWSTTLSATGRIEIVQNGAVVAFQEGAAGPGAPVRLTASPAFARSGWIAARRMGPNGHTSHTAAVFISVAGRPARASSEDAEFFVRYLDNLLRKTAPGGEWSGYFTNQHEAARSRYEAAAAIYRRIASEARQLKGGQ
jgi:drug/metabolite transporter (DMT)-like permease